MLTNNVNADSKNKNLFSVDYSTEVELYNYDNEICAYYYKINQSGYVIIDSITNDIIEFSYNDDNTNITADEGKQYYFGIFEYYEKRANKYKNTRTKIVINKSKAEELNDGYEDIRKEASSGTFVDGTRYNEPIGVVSLESKKELPYATVAVNNNSSGTCGSTAATILLLYYYDHISTKYVSSKNRLNYDYLTNELKPYIESKSGGSSYSELKNGINKYLGNRGLSKNCDYITTMNVVSSPFSKLQSYINSKKPCIAGLK